MAEFIVVLAATMRVAVDVRVTAGDEDEALRLATEYALARGSFASIDISPDEYAEEPEWPAVLSASLDEGDVETIVRTIAIVGDTTEEP